MTLTQFKKNQTLATINIAHASVGAQHAAPLHGPSRPRCLQKSQFSTELFAPPSRPKIHDFNIFDLPSLEAQPHQCAFLMKAVMPRRTRINEQHSECIPRDLEDVRMPADE
jgi:hypothetical protein